jgi:hypothetical protein
MNSAKILNKSTSFAVVLEIVNTNDDTLQDFLHIYNVARIVRISLREFLRH